MSAALAVFAIVLVMNAVNFIDGLDGLVAGVSLIANGSAVARVRDGQRVLAPSTTMFRLAL